MTTASSFVTINTVPALERLGASLVTCPWIALDTEFVREQTYAAVPCLLQIASPDQIYLVDTQALPKLDPLHVCLAAPSCIKIMHAASQDIELLYQRGVPSIASLFDTQIAHALLGGTDQIGYAALVQEKLQITLDKDAQRTDWSRRPLSLQQLNYAADDVRHLGKLYTQLATSLEELHRLDWLWEETKRLCNPTRYQVDVEQAWRRLKGMTRLRPDEQSRLRALASWRETTALQLNRPRKWILADDLLYVLARKNPSTSLELASLGLPPSTQRRQGDAILTALQRAANFDVAPIEELEWTEAERQQLKTWAAIAQTTATEQKIAAPLLATRSELEKYLLDNPASLLNQGWRKSVIGDALRAARV